MRYPKPKILLIDMSPDFLSAFEKKGYCVESATLGAPYRIEQQNSLFPISTDGYSMPTDFGESDIIFIDVGQTDPLDISPAIPADGVPTWWISGVAGVIDHRPLAMHSIRDKINRIYDAGGIIVVVLSDYYQVNYVKGARQGYGFRTETEHEFSNIDFLRHLKDLTYQPRQGSELVFEKRPLATLLGKAATGAGYRVAFHHWDKERFHPLIKNKFGDIVGGAFIPDGGSAPILLLPPLPDLHSVAVRMVEDFFVEFQPKLFPFHDGARWVQRDEYEFPEILLKKKELERINRETEILVSSLNKEIEQIRIENAHRHSILQDTGDKLVQAVIKALGDLGFQKVVDVDAQEKKAGASNLKEDVQVWDRSQTLIIDIKGISGTAADDECTQSEKHALMRIREWKRVDVKALTIINHQRQLPPLDRDPAFRDEIVQNAVHSQLGLMTTWQLFLLLQNSKRLGWTAEQIMPVLYRSGEIYAVPEHYRLIGKVVKAWSNKFGIIPNKPLKVGERLAVLSGDYFVECVVESLQVEGKDVMEAGVNDKCGVVVSGGESIKVGVDVFQVSTEKDELATPKEIAATNA